MAAAVLLDAFLLRTLLVPALMHLSGRANWWLPGWLDRILPHLSIEPAAEPPAPSPVPAPARQATHSRPSRAPGPILGPVRSTPVNPRCSRSPRILGAGRGSSPKRAASDARHSYDTLDPTEPPKPEAAVALDGTAHRGQAKEKRRRVRWRCYFDTTLDQTGLGPET